MRPVATMGICVKNGAKNIAEALDSIECQDFPHEAMEIIIVDDGSKDNTLEVVRKRVQNIDIRTRVFQFEWQGLGAARNVIVKLAEGDYIIWVDSDMILPKNHVRKQISFMERNQKIGIAKAKYGAMQDNNIIGFLENVGYVAADYIHGRKSTVRTLGTGGSIYRVKSIRQVGGFDNKISGVGEDMDAEIRVRKAGWGLFLGSPAIFYERRRESIVEIWREGVWHGYGGHKIIKKHGSISGLVKMTPLGGFVAGAIYAPLSFKISGRLISLLLPFEYAFKRLAWICGFIKSQMSNH